MTISDRIKEGLQIRNMKQVELVEKTGIGKGALSSYISGKYNPKQNNIYKIAKALDVNEAWLMGYDVPMERINQLNKLEVTNDELDLLNNYNKLNDLGKKEASKRVAELTEINKYSKSSSEATASKRITYDDFDTVAAHNDDLTADEIAEADRRILEDLNKRQ
ncbi:helix-turn-helix transcriptional regulator [Clostridium sp.]|uniref:helix-turn-helix domain-containing protein n=1 Tax=Clostridium sp. TaxID=1506 RepID=UPI001DF24665|nr:helix-turn-helix transcriptional regulator [Clostridium sp.]MBS5308774.1 helix-turn-helix transcriptional regulator [Clostridium sp.]